MTPLQMIAAGRVVGDLVGEVGRAVAGVTDRVAPGTDFASILTAGGLPDASAVLDQIRGALGSLGQAVTLRADQGSLRVDGDHPQAAAIEAKLSRLPALADLVSSRFADRRVTIDAF